MTKYGLPAQYMQSQLLGFVGKETQWWDGWKDGLSADPSLTDLLILVRNIWWTLGPESHEILFPADDFFLPFVPVTLADCPFLGLLVRLK